MPASSPSTAQRRRRTRGTSGPPTTAAAPSDEVIERHGRLDILVNNAGITSDKTVFKLTDEDWYKVLAVNLSGAFFMSQAVLPHMLERGSGRIINISSIIGETGNVGQVNYASSKSGLFGLTKSLAREAAFALKRAGKEDGLGITVNAVTPGFIETEMIGRGPREGARARRSPDPARPAGPARGDRARRPLPGRGRLGLHHGPGLGRQRRHGHVAVDIGDVADDATPLGEYLRRQRELQETSMRRMAELAGISNPYLSQIEPGLREPSEKVLDALASALEVSADALYEQAGRPRATEATRRR